MVFEINAQEEKHLLRLGISFGMGTQQFLPYNSPDYKYNVTGYKAVINYRFKELRFFSFEFQSDPGIFFARYTLLNPYFVQPDYGPDYLELREIYTKERTFVEYVLNLGILIRYKPKGRLSFFLLGSIGPMISGTETERLAKGFAFSDIVGIGASYKTGRFVFDIQPSLRHVSNADIKFPNCGHNSSNINLGISIFL
jgi:hypothetical protein